MLKVSFSTLGCPDWSWWDVLRNGPAAGYQGVEIRLLERETDLLKRPELQPDELARRRRELDEAGFAVCGLASSVRFDEPDPKQRSHRLDEGRRYVELARELCAGFVRVFGDVLPEGDEATRENAIAIIADHLHRLGEHAEALNVGIVVETHGDFAASARMERLMSLVHSPAVGVLWDTHHPWRFFGEPLPESFARLRPWVRHTHWKDSVLLPEKPLSQQSAAAEAQAHSLMSGHKPADYVLFGGGEFPIVETLRLLHNAGYDGWYSLEWERMWHPDLAPPEVALPLFPRKLRELAELAWDANPRA